MNPIVNVQHVQKNYGAKEVLSQLTFQVNKGECFGLIGHNGTGKSTTIDCILGIKPFQHGEITLLDYSSKQLPKTLFEKIGVQFQQSNYSKQITVAELCRVTASYYQNPQPWQKLVKDFGLSRKEKQKVETLSGGEKQKLSVLLTLIPNPEIIFLDELTTGLDTVARRQVWKLLENLKKQGLTIFLTSHFMDEVEILCDRIGILVDGVLIIQGTVPEVIAQSQQETLEEAYLWYTEEEEHAHI